MIILTLRSDNPMAELALYDDDKQIGQVRWEAHRQLAETIHLRLKELLNSHHKQLSDIGGIVAYHGPGSFTGLRIGLSVANALADSLPATIVATTGDDWQEQGIKQLLAGQDQKLVTPDYGAPVHITTPRK